MNKDTGARAWRITERGVHKRLEQVKQNWDLKSDIYSAVIVCRTG